MQAIADALTARGIRTRDHARDWHAAQVARIIQRAMEDAPVTIARLEAEAAALRKVLAMERERQGSP